MNSRRADKEKQKRHHWTGDYLRYPVKGQMPLVVVTMRWRATSRGLLGLLMHDSAKHGVTDLSNTCLVTIDQELSFFGKERLPFRTMRDGRWVWCLQATAVCAQHTLPPSKANSLLHLFNSTNNNPPAQPPHPRTVDSTGTLQRSVSSRDPPEWAVIVPRT